MTATRLRPFSNGLTVEDYRFPGCTRCGRAHDAETRDPRITKLVSGMFDCLPALPSRAEPRWTQPWWDEAALEQWISDMRTVLRRLYGVGGSSGSPDGGDQGALHAAEGETK